MGRSAECAREFASQGHRGLSVWPGLLRCCLKPQWPALRGKAVDWSGDPAMSLVSQCIHKKGVSMHTSLHFGSVVRAWRLCTTVNGRGNPLLTWTHFLSAVCLFVCWLLNVPATGECISGTDLLRQLYVLPHWDRSCRSNVLPHPVTVYWHWTDQSQRWPYNARRLAG